MDQDDLHTIVYMSSLVAPWSEAMIEGIVRHSRERNARDGVTGVLLHCDGSVMQYLEGPKATVQATFRRIANDARHSGLLVVIDAPASDRTFPSWVMGHLEVTRSEFLQLESAEWRRVAEGAAADSTRSSTSPGLALLRHFSLTAQRR